MAFDRDQFVEDCTDALYEDDPQAAILDHLSRAMRDHTAVLAAMGEPRHAGMDVLIASRRLTIFGAMWAPNMTLAPHNHHMWALIGIYTGREDNIFWKQTSQGLRAGGASCLFAGDVASLPRDVIHSVTNPLGRFTGGLHIYGGDFFNTERALWNPETLDEQPSNGDTVRALFEAENARLRR